MDLGFDTRYSFTDHLYNTLVKADITTFLDEEGIETGLPLKPELETAIKASRASIIVLSQNYASSTRCLDELVLILEQRRNRNYFVIPIFYHVEPTDVRKQQNSFGEAMAKHHKRMETETDPEKRYRWDQKIDRWNKALTEVAGLKGEHITKGRKEVGFIEDIVTNIRRRLGVLLSTPQPLIIGRKYDTRYITTWLKDRSSHPADIFTISGMAGIGKTTLAKHVYRSNCACDTISKNKRYTMKLLERPTSKPLRYREKYELRGSDTRSSFTDHLYNTLVNANITTFLDDEEIETGLPLKPELETAIRASRASIIVLSQNYASSTWCLDELVLILEQQLRRPNYFVIPIFYHVEPTDVRKQQNRFGEAMAKYKQRMEKEVDAEKRSQWAQKIDLWNKALTEVAGLKGEYIAKGRKEVGFIEDIVTNIRRRLGVLLSTPQPLIIGMEYDIKNITTWLNDGSSHTADIFTISGMGGIRKTTLAKHVYRLNCGEFQKSSFIEGIGRTCAKQYNGLLDLQKQICGDISKPDSIQVRGDVFVYTSKIEKALAHKKVFVVLDDVGSLEHLDALITWKQSLSAFNCNDSKDGYEDVSNKLVEYCNGHPLALEVLGKALRNKDVAQWEDYIERLLKKDRESTEIILKACEFHTISGIKNLVDRSLLSIGWKNTLMMHQLIQETGRDIVRQESPNRPEKRSRLWCHEESFKGKGNVQGLVLDMRMLEEDKLYELETEALSKMDNLKLLQLNYVQLKGSYENFPEELRWLCMHGFPLDHIPPGLQMENLVCLDMSYSKLICFDMSYGDTQRSRKRKKILNLNYCEQLGSLGGFSEFLELERLMLSNCISLIEICESIEQCDGLDHIDLSYCKEVGKVLRTIGKVKNVKTLNLDGCNLSELSMVMRADVEVREMLNGNNIGMNSKTSSSAIVEAIPRALDSNLIYLPSSLVCLSLQHNNLSNESFPKDMSSLSMLKELYLDGNDIVSLPTCVRTLPTLEKLSIGGCPRLKTLEHPPHTLKELIYGFSEEMKEGKVVFDREMNTYGGSLVEGLYKRVDTRDVEEEVLRSLGWGFTKNQITETKVEMHYNFGIFSTCYQGKEIPNWISERREGSSLSFSIPSSAILRGLNFCFVLMGYQKYSVHIKISNITKNLTWIYQPWLCYEKSRESITYLSHWMFGKNEMEDGDQITISISKKYDGDGGDWNNIIRECGISLVYDEGDDGKEEDVLGYYKSWNHRIGGDLSPFQTTTPGQYLLDSCCFFGFNTQWHIVINGLGLELLAGQGRERGPYSLDKNPRALTYLFIEKLEV
ncbi:hypothetical protein OSB04_un000966 [Centaurea solstitialis]|uniref:TIR domain-containing protein n=1 Tax=Centaurea solstitialis TaxID=347529 RepID=A0AA38SBL7_9ASTR|nr:hypothetical protein OSB04_un000966 [Centaurea solstitialis]